MIHIRLLIILCVLPFSVLAQWMEVTPEVAKLFPTATRTQVADEMGLTPVFQLNQQLGFVFESDDLVNFPGFSGESINLRVGLDMQGVIQGVEIVRHHEPIFLHGLGEDPLLEFIAQYVGRQIKHRFIVGSRQGKMADGRTVYLDGVTKATVSVMVVNDTLITAASKVARAKLQGFGGAEVSSLKQNNYEAASLSQLAEQGAIFRWQMTLDEAADALDIQPERLAEVTNTSEDEGFIDIQALFVSSPLIGINLLGQQEYQRLLAELAEGEIPVVLLSRGAFDFVGDDFVAGTSPSRLGLQQNEFAVDLRDIDFYSYYSPRVSDELDGYRNIRVFVIQGSSGFDPAKVMDWRLTVNLSNNFLLPRLGQLSESFQLPESLTEPPPEAEVPLPLWMQIWQQRLSEIIILSIYLLLLGILFTKQRSLSVRFGRYLLQARLVALLFTISFIGYYTQGQLSVVNIYTLLLSVWNGFDIQVFLLDPVIFILWSFVFVSLFLWGRGLFCGWLCPFGAIQELMGQLAAKLRLPQWKPDDRLHRRLQLIKYPMLLLLVAVSFYSLSLAETLAEVEPFKTAVTMNFVRYWPFTLYALLLLAAGLFIHKFYCRYLCPLGAGLAILGRLRLFSWLRRRDECGQPCQLCNKQCQIKAIHSDGRIDYDECIQCLECLVIIDDSKRCVVSRYGNKSRKRALNQNTGVKVVEIKTT